MWGPHLNPPRCPLGRSWAKDVSRTFETKMHKIFLIFYFYNILMFLFLTLDGQAIYRSKLTQGSAWGDIDLDPPIDFPNGWT